MDIMHTLHMGSDHRPTRAIIILLDFPYRPLPLLPSLSLLPSSLVGKPTKPPTTESTPLTKTHVQSKPVVEKPRPSFTLVPAPTPEPTNGSSHGCDNTRVARFAADVGVKTSLSFINSNILHIYTTRNLRHLGRPPKRYFHYSSGMQAMVMALGVYDKVSLFGFGKLLGANHNYHTNQKELDLHDYEAEYNFYNNLQARPEEVPFLNEAHGFTVSPVRPPTL
ncbi:hypothetical protein E2562_005614 [Oryza meyeriana var. granulata]|uniref:Uncharacterized protein n=1 Tax=Oryza meyeriana var. granulata TaxID=110450 RepID=A0A6G1F486_9ORYZ|nr:hypothetical protein E2562_005614 [Oryza meyeriana var. granulata]